MPLALISTSTSPAFGPSRSTSTISSGFPASNATAARLLIGDSSPPAIAAGAARSLRHQTLAAMNWSQRARRKARLAGRLGFHRRVRARRRAALSEGFAQDFAQPHVERVLVGAGVPILEDF